jgi:hypothetical protein
MARHEFNPLEPRVAIYEIVSGFVAALSVGVAGAFGSDKTTPKWLLIALFFGGLALWVGAILWLFLAHRRVARDEAFAQRSPQILHRVFEMQHAHRRRNLERTLTAVVDRMTAGAIRAYEYQPSLCCRRQYLSSIGGTKRDCDS